MAIPQVMQPPTGNITFVFTDIERSSQLWERHPQAMTRALARHDALLREIFEEHSGYVFKTMGDAFCVAFSGALDATKAALAVQRALAGEPWEEIGSLRVRIALHSGEADERDGDYFGQALNRVARLLGSGHGGQVLLSRVTAERVREKAPREITLRDLGERRLKDLSRPERIYQLGATDLPSDFPPLRSLEVLPNNLPAQVTSFVGRAREMVEVKRLLATTRLLTLTGPGGAGKTRLSLQTAAEVLEDFPHGVWLVELATLSDPDLLPGVIAAALEIREEPERPLRTTLLDALRARRLLLLIDNCEHLINACAELAETLLRHCPDLHILATSREPMNISGELTWPVPSLKNADFWRDDAMTLSTEDIAALEAVQLFMDRATAVLPDFALTAETAPIVGKICWRLDGIPLAIELAAARVKVLTPAQILDRLDDRFRLLSGGRRTALPRQQTLGALIDWSYDLLSDDERTLLRRLSIFAGGRTLEMAEQVCAGEGLKPREILDLLGSLVDKSLLAVEPDGDGEPRYIMLESIWDYASEKLDQSGERERLSGRHLDYFVTFAEKVEPLLMGADQADWLERLETDRLNLRLALEWSVESGTAVERGLRLAVALSRFWEVRSYLHEGREHFENLLARVNTAAGIPAVTHARALAVAGRLAWCQDRDEDALRHFRAALPLFEAAGLPAEVGTVHAFMGFTERNEENLDAARTHFEQARRLGLAENHDRLLASALSGLGSIAADTGDFPTAREHKERALQIFRQHHDHWIVSLIAWSTGKVAAAQGDHAAARAFLTEAVTLGRKLGNRWAVPYTLEGFGDIALAQNDGPRAARLYGAASALRESVGLSFSPGERTSYQATLARLRTLLAPETYETHWRSGRSLRAEEALGFALGDPASLVQDVATSREGNTVRARPDDKLERVHSRVT